MSKEFKFGQDARDEILRGVNIVAKAVGSTLGPRGRLVAIDQRDNTTRLTKDGISTAQACLPLKNKFQNMGARLVTEAAQRTCDSSGDGTTSSTILTQAIVNEGARLVAAGHNQADIKRGIDNAVSLIVEELRKVSQPIKSQKEIEQVGTISANGDSEIGKLIAEAIEAVGSDGIVSLETSQKATTQLIKSNGYQIDRGYVSPHFVTNEKLEAVLNNPIILIVDKPVSNTAVILPILQKCHEAHNGRPLLLICEACEGECLATLVLNHVKQSFRSCVIKNPGFGDRRKELLSDIAVLTGGEVVSEELGHKIENFDISWLGQAKQAVVTKNSCTIIEGAGSGEAIEQRVVEIRNFAQTQTDDWDRKKQEERLAKLVSGCAIISIGGQTEAEVGEKFDRFEDSLSATRSAIQEGIVSGGGIALLKCSKVLDSVTDPDLKIGAQIVKKAAEEPLRRIIENAGLDSAMVRINVLANASPSYGFNARTEKYEDLMESGVIDPTKVVINALQNAASVAGVILMTECMIADEPEPKGDDQK